jgi:uncharacterized protein YbjT (DUF2867 family)
MILVTGAAGKTGRAVIQALVARGNAVRALAHRPEQAGALEALGAREIVTGDMRLPATLEAAAQTVRAVYHICPNVSPDEVRIGEIAIAAARKAGVQHFAYHSVLHPQVEAMPHHWYKLRVEEQLFESGMPFTIVQPGAYMQNVLGHWHRILEESIYPVPYALDARLSLVDLEDVAEAVAVVLTEPGHAGATYELVGPEALSQVEIAATLAKQLGRTVRAQQVPLDKWEEQARRLGMGAYSIEALIRMFQYYDRYGFWGSSQVLGWLLGRPPATFASFAARTVRERLVRSSDSPA